MKLFTILALAVGLALFGYLLMHFGAVDVFAGVAAAGWVILWVSLYRFVTIAAHGAGWRVLFPAGAAPTFAQWMRARWAGEAINSLLPVAQVGGDVARAEMIAHHTSSGALASATVVVDFTLGLVAQFLFTVAGAALLIAATGGGSRTNSIVIGIGYAAALLAALLVTLRSSMLGRISEALARRGEAWSKFAGGLGELHSEILRVLANRARAAACVVVRLSAWVLMAGEVWLVMWFLGQPVSWSDAVILESLTMAVRSAAFVLPGALGAQEAAFVLIGPMVGVPAEIALTLALVKRVRELLVGIPGIWVWAATEHKRLASLFSTPRT